MMLFNSEPTADRKIFRREIIFAKTPIDGFFRYKDLFQIFPANLRDMPTSKAARHYPIILEYWYDKEEQDEIKVDDEMEGLEDLMRLTAISFNKKESIMSILSLVTTHLFFTYASRDSRWGFPILKEPTDGEANNWSSKWCLEWFMWPSLPEQLKIENLSTPKIKPIAQIPWQKYFQFNPNFDWNTEVYLQFPDITLPFIECYFSTDSDTRKVIDSAIASSNAAMEFMNSRKKLSLLSAFTAIETLVNLENRDYKPTRCPECGQEIFKVSAKYREFLLKYIGDSKNNKAKFNAYYSLRSKIVHAGQDFQTEKLFAEVEKDVKNKEQLQIAEVITLSKLAIIMWTIKTSSFYKNAKT